MKLRQEIDHHLRQGFREFSLALRAESEAARTGHIEMAQHSEFVQRLRDQLHSEEQASMIQAGIWA
jgi:hypothetical protein